MSTTLYGHYGKRPSKDLVIRMHGLYLCGMSLSKVGKRFGYSRQWIWNYFKELDLQTRSVKRKETITYNGLKYTWNNKGYYRCTTQDRHILHYRVWLDNTGTPVPEDHEVLFMDGNKHNFEFSNLQLVKGKGSVSRIRKVKEQ